MENISGKNKAKIDEMKKNTVRINEVAAQMSEEAKAIHRKINSIDTNDIGVAKTLEKTKASYSDEFNKAFEKKVEKAGDEVEKQGEDVMDSAGTERNNVNDGIRKMTDASGISETGREVAETAKKELEHSEGVFGQQISDAGSTIDDMRKKIAEQRRNLNNHK